MVGSAPAALADWSAFFGATAGSAATLTGLMFVVITLIRREDFEQTDPHDGISTFSTPTVVHFGSALFVSVILMAPWPSMIGPFLLEGVIGLVGLLHIVRVVLRAQRRISEYDPDVEDWIWYWILPFFAYCIVLGGAIALPFTRDAPFVLGGSVLLLIFIGIRNSWDVVTFIAAGGPSASPSKENKS